jgi:hypothetical protein
VQTKTQLNGDRLVGGQSKGRSGNRTSWSANDGESTNPWQRHGN